MAIPSLSLIVIRSPDIERSCRFYEALGCEFTKHSHGKGPEHYAADLGAAVFEIYPLSEGQLPTTSVRLGFHVADVDASVQHLVDLGGKVVQQPMSSEWGRRAVLDDLDGHRIELLAAE